MAALVASRAAGGINAGVGGTRVALLSLFLALIGVLAVPAALAQVPDGREKERRAMVQEQLVNRGVKSKVVLDAMRHVPRHWFVPDHLQHAAYEDGPLPIGHGQTISQPYIVGFMTEALKLKAGDRVLEIGTGSGYQAAILAKLAEQVYTIEIVEPLGVAASKTLPKLGFGKVHVRVGDGYKGWPQAAPFDAIMLTAAPEKMPQPLIDQLAAGGRLVAPLGARDDQTLVRITKDNRGKLKHERLFPVRFVPMTGEAQSR